MDRHTSPGFSLALQICFGLAMDWNRIGTVLASDWYRIGRKKSRICLGLMSDGLDQQRIGDGLVLDWGSIDSAVYRIGNALT